MKPRVLAVLLVVLPTAAAAQESNPPDDSIRFKTEVVVTPERTETPRALVPASTTVLPAATLLTFPAINFANFVSFMPGFFVAEAEFHARQPVLSARGFFGGGEAEYVLLLIDGVPVADTESGLIDWSGVTASSIRAVEASRGPGASMYGDSAVAGVLQVLTDRNPGVRANVAGGSFRTYVADAAAGRRFGGFGVDASGAARRTRGFSDHASARELIGSVSADGPVGAAIWRWTGSANNRRRDDPGALPLQTVQSDPAFSDPTYRFDYSHRHGLATSFAVQHAGDTRTGVFRLYANTRDDAGVRTVLLAPGASDRRRRAITAMEVGATAQGGSTLGANGRARAQFGIDVTRDRLTTSYQSVTDGGQVGDGGPEVGGRRLRAGAFASSSWDASTRLRFTGALRWDGVGDRGFSASQSSHDHAAWSPRIGVTFQPAGAGRVAAFAQLSKAFKVPTLDQLFDPRPFPDFRGGTFTISNATLRPQRATNIEGGISGSSRLNWSLLVYRMNVDDEIDFDVGTFSYGNIASSRHAGVEAEATGRAWAWLESSAAYAWTRVTETGERRQLKNVPRHTLTLSANVTLPWAFGVYGRYRGVAGAFLDDENTVPLRGLATFDVRIRRTTGGQTLFVDVLNLADARYEEYGFTLTDFRGRIVPYAYPGAPRAVRVGISVALGGPQQPATP